MSKSIDERIVEMQFNNRQFESGVKESLSSLDKLKKGLNLGSATKSLTGLSDAGKKFSLGGIASGVDHIASRFTVMGAMGFAALQRIANAAITTGKQIVSSLTVDPVKMGFDEYELKMGSVQTIMAGSGEDLATVNKYLQELNAYSDKTIYSFKDMTSNIGKFTNAGVSLKDSVAAIQGISNVAARSGANAQEASRAMYNFSQAISSGYVKLIDWKSIELANMATKEFKTYLLDTAVAAGQLKKNSNGMYVTLKGNELNATKNFNDTLTDQWMTTEVLTKTLQMYSDETTDIGKKAFAAAQDVKTLSQMYDTLKEAAQSGWAQTFELLLGDFEEGKKLFTEINNVIGGMISRSADARNTMLKLWKEAGGRDLVIEGLKNAFFKLGLVLDPIKRAFQDVFPKKTVGDIMVLTRRFRDFFANLTVGIEAMYYIHKIAKGFFTAIKIGLQIVSALTKNIIEFVKSLKPMGKSLRDTAAKWSDWLVNFETAAKKGDIFNEAFTKVRETISKAGTAIADAFKKMISAFQKFTGLDLTSFNAFVDTVTEKFRPIQKIGEIFRKVFGFITGILAKAGPIFGKAGKAIGNAFKGLDIQKIAQIFNAGMLGGFLFTVQKLISSFTKIGEGTGSFIADLGKIPTGIVQILGGVKGALTAWQQDIKANTLIKIAIALGLLAASLLLLSLIDGNKLGGAIAALTVLFAELFGSMSIFDKVAGSTGFKSMGKLTRSMLLLSASLLILSYAVSVLAQLDWDELTRGMLGLTGLIAIMVGASKALSKSSGSMIKAGVGLIVFAFAIKVLSKSVAVLGNMDTDVLAKGLLGVLAIAGTLAAFLKIAKLNDMGMKQGAGLMLLAVAIRVLVMSVKSLGKMDPAVFAGGLLGLITILATLAGFTHIVDEKQLIGTAIGLTILGVAMLIFASAVEKFGKMPILVLVKGLVALGVAVAGLALALKLMPPNMFAMGLGMLAVSAGMLLIAKALTMMSEMTWEEVGRGLVALAGAMIILVVAVNAMSGALAGAAAIFIVSGALIGLAFALKLLATMSLTEIGIALLALAGTFVVLGAAAAILTPLLLPMAGLGVVLLLMGAGLAAIGAASLILSIGLGALSVVGLGGIGILLALTAALIPMTLLAPAMLVVGAGLLILSAGVVALGFALSIFAGGLGLFVAMGPAGIEALQAFVSMAATMSEFAIQIVIAGAGLIVFGAGAILAGAGALLGGLGIFVLALALQQLAAVDLTNMEEITPLSKDLLKTSALLLLAAPGLLAGGAALMVFGAGASNTGEGLKSITNGIMDVVKTLKDVPDMVNTAGNSILAVITMLMKHVQMVMLMQGMAIVAVVADITDKSVDTINSKRYMFLRSGVNLVEGFIEGIQSKVSAAARAAGAMAASALRAANQKLEIESPSGAFEDVGMYADLGLAKGLKKYAHLAENAAASLGEKTLTPVLSMATASSSSRGITTPNSSSIASISRDLQNGTPMQRTLDSLSSMAGGSQSSMDLSGILTVQVKNDRGEIIGIAQTAIKDLLRRESR